MKKLLFSLVLILCTFMVIAEHEPGHFEESLVEDDEFGFLEEDYNSAKINELTYAQLHTAIVDGRISDYSFIDDINLKDTIVQHPDLWQKDDLVTNVNERVANDVSFINDATEFKTAWFKTFEVTCADCKIGKFSTKENIVQTIDATATGVLTKDALTVVDFSLKELGDVEILKNGQLKMRDDTIIGNAVVTVNQEEGSVKIAQFLGGFAQFELGEKNTKYVYHLSNRGGAKITDGVFITGKDLLISIENGKHIAASLSNEPVEFRYAKSKTPSRKSSTKSIIPYAFTGVITFNMEDLEITRKNNRVQNLRFSHVSLGENTKFYDFNTGNSITVEKPTEYYHSSEALLTRQQEDLQCQSGSNCIEYYVDKSQLGGVMRVHATDNNHIKVNVQNLETRDNVRYKSFQQKDRKEIDLELATLFVDVIGDDSTITVNDNSKVIFEFAMDKHKIRGKLTDRTISTIEMKLPVGGLVDDTLVDVNDDVVEGTEFRTYRIDRNALVGICTDETCSTNGFFTSEELKLTPAEISERVYIAGHRYALCSEVSKKCNADYGAFGFKTTKAASIPQHFHSSRVQWATTCIGLTKAALSPGLEEGLSAEIEEKVKRDKFADTGFFVQDYLRENVPGFKSTYIVVEEYFGYREGSAGEGTVLELVQNEIKKGENIDIIVVTTDEERRKILAGISRGSLVTEPVKGHDYIYAGLDSLTQQPTTYEAHVAGVGISRDVNGVESSSILITYDEKSSQIDRNDILANSGTIYTSDGKGGLEVKGSRTAVQKRIDQLIKDDKQRVRERRALAMLVE